MKHIGELEERKYPMADDAGESLLREPAVGYVQMDGQVIGALTQSNGQPGLPLGQLGFFTDDEEELRLRVESIEKSLESAEQGDESEWLTDEEFDNELRSQFPWLS